VSGQPDPDLRFPDFYIAGHQKCGTTALYLTLAERDDVFLPQVKEPKYFATELRSVLHREGEVNPLHTEAGYLALYADARPGQLRGDASPQYLRSRAAPGLIAERRPDAKLIAIFREPADFLRSFHQQMLSSRVEDVTDLRRALELEDERRAGREIPRGCHLPMSLYYSEHVRYAEQLGRLRENFPPENIHVIIYDDLKSDPQGTMSAVVEFLGLPPGEREVAMRRTKPLQQARSSGLHRFAGELRRAKRRPESVGTAARVAGAVIPERLLDSGARNAFRRVAYTRPEQPDAQLAAELRARFAPEVAQLGAMIDRDLGALWGPNGNPS
jgi:hypothetical protein